MKEISQVQRTDVRQTRKCQFHFSFTIPWDDFGPGPLLLGLKSNKKLSRFRLVVVEGAIKSHLTASSRVNQPIFCWKKKAIFFSETWAKTQDYGQKYGRKYIEPFKEDIVEMFKAGNDNLAKKKGPGRMLGELKRKYPTRLDLPSEAEIRGYVGSLLAKHRKGQQV